MLGIHDFEEVEMLNIIDGAVGDECLDRAFCFLG